LIDDAPLSGFHLRTALYANGGHLCDGYILGIVVPALPLFTAAHPVGPTMNGLLGASALFGVLLGSLVFGWVTDRAGRRRMFVLGMLANAVLSLAQLAVTDVLQLFILRLLLGIVVGADYTIASTLVAEAAPRRQRATLLALGPAMWAVGYVAAAVVGTVMQSLGPDGWRWILATSAVPALVLLVLRRQTPESPRWLASKGRVDEALAVLRAHVSPEATLADLPGDPARTGRTSLTEVFAPAHRGRLMFVGLFWFCQIVPYFAVFTFLPTILESLGIRSGFWQSTSINLFLVVGGAVGVVLITRLGRRTLTLVSFALMTLATAAIGLWQSAPAAYVVALFALFALVSSAISALETVYPAELFPTDIRATATGLCVALSRVGAAAGTLLLPIGIAHWGAHGVTLAAAGISAVGFLISLLLAPETAHLALDEAASTPAMSPAPAPAPARVPRKRIT
jgi:putative MFS transporter